LLWTIVKIRPQGNNKCIYVKLLEKHPREDSKGLVLYHRVLMENHIGRLLTEDEIVTFINGNNRDVRIENLQIKIKRKNPPKCEKCLQCGKETDNPKFCSMSCSTTYNNKLYPKRYKTTQPKERLCVICSSPREKHRTKYCNKCYQERAIDVKWKETSIEEIRSQYPYQKSIRIREYARTVYKKSDKPKYCVVCGYSKHYEICHIKAVKDFSTDATMEQVNNLDNLIALCPTHHWELDAGYLDLDKLNNLAIDKDYIFW